MEIELALERSSLVSTAFICDFLAGKPRADFFSAMTFRKLVSVAHCKSVV